MDAVIDCLPSYLPDGSPVSGGTQPDKGTNCAVRYLRMGRPKKNLPKPVTPGDVIGSILANNITERLPGAFPRASNETAQIEALAKRSGVGEETIRTMLRLERSPRLNTIDAIARALGTSASELITIPRNAGESGEIGRSHPSRGHELLQRRSG